MHPDAAFLIEKLQLRPHPEGGFYREIFRSDATVRAADERGARPALTTIYFLLPAHAHSRWHRVRSDEVWHLYDGGPLELWTAAPALDAVERVLLGPAATSAGPVQTVAAGQWQAARALDRFVLAGCTVGPGFDFADFSFLRDDPDALARLTRIGGGLELLA
jgi:hypothetical protein